MVTKYLWPLQIQKQSQGHSAFHLGQRFSTSESQKLLKHALPDCLVRGTDLFSLRLSNKKMTAANTTVAVQYE